MATVLLSVPPIRVLCLVFLVPLEKGSQSWRCVISAWDAVAFLVKKRDGHEVIVPSLSSFSDVEILVLISCCPGGSLDCLLGSRNPKQAMTSWSFLSAQNFVAFTQSRAPTFPIRQNVQAVGPSYNFVMILSASQNSSLELRQLCSNCTAWCLSNTLLKTGLFLEYALSEESVLHSRIPGLAPAFVTFT